MPKLSKITLSLTVGYFVIWLLGPLFISTNIGIQQTSFWLGLPLWFWLSGIGGPLMLLATLSLLTIKRVL